jgi:hypothetical protein
MPERRTINRARKATAIRTPAATRAAARVTAARAGDNVRIREFLTHKEETCR